MRLPYTLEPVLATTECGGRNRGGAHQLTFFVASGVSRIIILRRAFEKRRKIREFEPTHVGGYVIVARNAPGLEPGVFIVLLQLGPVLALPCYMDELKQRLDRFMGKTPVLGREVYLAPGAVVVGDVTLGDNASVWFNAVLRGDIERIVIGHHTNVQDNAVLHLSDTFPCIVGNYVTIGHGAIVHACTVGDETLIGMGATLLDGSIIGRQCIVGANALVSEGRQFPDGSLILGMPARVVRELSPEERAGLKEHAEKYTQMARYFLNRGRTNPRTGKTFRKTKPNRMADGRGT